MHYMLQEKDELLDNWAQFSRIKIYLFIHLLLSFFLMNNKALVLFGDGTKEQYGPLFMDAV